MRILHTSDWHIGRQFHNVSLIDDQRHQLEQIIEIITQEKVDVVLVAGDLYDRSMPSAEAVALLDEVINRISQELAVPLIMIAGNHDSPERIGFGARQMARAGVYLSGVLEPEIKPLRLQDQHGIVEFFSIPYADPATVKSCLDIEVNSHETAMQAILDRLERSEHRSVVIAHCFIDGGDESDSERPLSIGGADKISPSLFKSFDYVALGHLHAPQFKEEPYIRYSGSLLKYSFSEARQNKSVTLVKMDAKGDCEIKLIPLNPKRNMRVIEGALETLLVAAKEDPSSDDYLLVRLTGKEALLDPMSKLRQVYPNILHLERPDLLEGGQRKRVSKEKLARGQLPMFKDFYKQMTDDELDEEGGALIAEILESVNRSEVD
ncbi:MAG: exonuclease sbcCD subunit D [Gammaproteobacteria bacterium]|nr:MAG: exonuclease sbcCD subunit D [Gammaproteobacteria bacterium]RLA23441.1 MAG: exonuclease sbcCD subunit D [Gammaproteobacteria bacterium]